MRLNIRNRLKLCFEILTSKSVYSHSSQEKQLSTFKRGYEAGLKDAYLEMKQIKNEPF